MADDKKQGADQKAEGGKKKGLPTIVLIAVGAIVGGAGVVFAVPPKTVEVEKPPVVYEDLDVTHPDLISKEFNPRTRAGKGVARVSFKFVYTVREDHEQQAFEQIKEHWEQANSNTLMILKTRSMEELQTESGIRILEHDLLSDLDQTLFPGHGDEKVATVTRILWKDLLLQ